MRKVTGDRIDDSIRTSLHLDREDKWVWRDPQSNIYSMKSAYKLLTNANIGTTCEHLRVLWSLKVIPSAQCLAWRALMDKIATKHRRGFSLGIHSVLCADVQRKQCITFLFPTLCNLCNNWLGVSSTSHKYLREHFVPFCFIGFNFKGKNLWKGLCIVVIRCTWKQRKEIVFRQSKVDPEEILSLAWVQAWACMKNKVTKVNFSYSD